MLAWGEGEDKGQAQTRAATISACFTAWAAADARGAGATARSVLSLRSGIPARVPDRAALRAAVRLVPGDEPDLHFLLLPGQRHASVLLAEFDELGAALVGCRGGAVEQEQHCDAQRNAEDRKKQTD